MAIEDSRDAAGELRDYVKESQEFLEETLGIAARLADQIKVQTDLIREKVLLDQETLTSSKATVKVLSGLKNEYLDIKNIVKDREKIGAQIQKNMTIIGAKTKTITKEEQLQAKAVLEANQGLESEAQTLDKIIAKRQNIEDSISNIEALGKDASDALYAELDALQQQEDSQRSIVAALNEKAALAGAGLSPEAAATALLAEQNQTLQEGLDHLNEEEDAIGRIQSAQSIVNATFGAAGGLLDTLGMSGVKSALGIDKAMEAAAKKADQLSDGGTKSIGVFGKMRVAASAFGAALSTAMAPAALIGGLVKMFKGGEQAVSRASDASVSFAKELGVSVETGKQMYSTSQQIAGEIGAFAENVQKNTAALQQQLGTTANLGKETLTTFNQLVEKGGFTVENAATFTKMAKLSNQPLKDTTAEMLGQIEAMKAQEGIALNTKDVMSAIGKTSAATRLTLGNSAKEMASAAFASKKLGLELDKVEGISGNLLQFEDSIAKEMEAELLLGKDINLEKARQAALEGDLAAVAREVADQIGSAEEFTKMNVIQQEALAASVGMTRDELASSLEQQQLLAGTDFSDMNSAQEKFNKLVESGLSIEEAKKQIGNEALANQLAATTYAEQQDLRQRSIQDSFAKVAEALLPIVNTFRDLAVKLAPLLAKVVSQLIGKFQPILDVVIQLADKFFEMSSSIMGPITNIIDQIFVALTPILDIVATIVGEVGGGLMDAFSVVVDIVSDLITVLGPVLAQVGQLAKDLLPPIKNLFESLKEPIQRIGEVVGKVLVVAFEAIVPILGTIMDLISSLLPPLLDAIVPVVETIVTVFAEIAEALLPAIADIFGMITPIIVDLLKTFQPIVDDILRVVVKSLLPIVVKLIKQLVPIIKTVIKAFMPLVEAAMELAKQLLPIVVKVLEAIMPVLEPILDVFISLVESIIPALIPAIEMFAGIIEDMLPLLTPFIDAISGVLIPLVNVVSNLFKGNFGEAFESLKLAFSGIITFIKDAFSGIFNFVKSIFGRVGEFLGKVFKTPINAIVGIINGLIDGINEALNFSLTNPITKTVYEMGVNIPNIPELATGGIVESPTMAVIGEAGPEAVIPLNKLSEYTSTSDSTTTTTSDDLKQEIVSLKETMVKMGETMVQLASRPMVVELDGNRVGETLGRSSYRVQ